MKKAISILFCLLLFSTQSSYSFPYLSYAFLDSNNLPISSVCKVANPITIDGLDIDWNTIDSIHPITNPLKGNPFSPSDLSGQFRVKWDDTYLYIFGTIVDDSYVNDSPFPWHDDSFEIYIDGGNEKDTIYDSNDHQLIFRYNSQDVFNANGNVINSTGIDFKFLQNNGNQNIEVRISWNFIGISTPSKGDKIGLDIHLNDDDTTAMSPGVLLPPSDWTVYFDPNDPNSYNQNRPRCQLITAGNRFNTGDIVDGIQAGSGYNLSFDSNSEIHSFPINGETLRFGTKTITGLCNTSKAFVLRHAWINDGSYDESQEQPTGVNMSTTFPGIDRTYFDGTRSQMACITSNPAEPEAVKVGPGADFVQVAATWRIEPWMLAADGNGALHSLIEPGNKIPSPIATYIGNYGTLSIVTRDTILPLTSGINIPDPTIRAEISISTSDVGNWWSIVYEYRIDPTGSGYLDVWLDKSTGNFQRIVHEYGSIGYRFVDGDPRNDLFYPIINNYSSWHRHGPAGVVNNWDSSFGNLREFYYAYSGVIVDGFKPAQELMKHANYFSCGTGTGNSGGRRDAKLAWKDTLDHAWRDPSVFGTITLEECGTVYIEPTIHLWLEGAFDTITGLHSTALLQKELLPSRQPYHNAPWSYPGLEGLGWIASDYPPGSVDWVLVSFRTQPAASTEVVRAAAVLLEDGSLYFPNPKILHPVLGSSFYIVVEHRNHMGVMSPSLVPVVGATITYDFRSADSWVHGVGFGQKSFDGQNTWMLYAGDGDQTSNLVGYDINGNDRSAWQTRNGIFGSYEAVDYNLDGDVSGVDRIFWDYNNGIFSSLER